MMRGVVKERPSALLIIVAIGLLVAGVGLRVYDLGLESFWVDEVFSALIVECPPGEIIDHIPRDKPPLDYYFQYAADKLPLEREASHRIPAAVAGILTLFLIWGLARRLFGARVAWGALAVASVHALLIHYSREARPYSPLTAIAAAHMWVFFAWWERLRSGRPWKELAGLTAGLTILSTLGLYTLYAMVMVMFAEGVFLLAAVPLLERRRPNWTEWGRPIALFIAMIGFLAIATLPLRGRADIRPKEDYFWHFKMPDLPGMLQWLAAHLAGPAPLIAWAWAATVPLLILVAIGLYRAWRDRPRAALFMTLILALFPLNLVFYSIIDREYYPRYTVYIVIGVCMLIALGADWIGERLRRPAATVLVIVAYAAGALALNAANRYEKTDWRGAAHYLGERIQPGERIVATSPMAQTPLKYYLKRNGVTAPCLLPFYADKLPEAPYWRVDHVYGHRERMAATVHGVKIESLGHAPPPERLEALAASLGNPPKLRAGTAPVELLGAGWSEPEHWSKTFSIRWISRTYSWLNLPLKEQAGAGRLSIRLMPAKWAQGPPQSIQPRIGALTLERKQLPAGFSTQSWDVPAGVLKRGFNRIELDVAWVRSPAADRPGYGDFRNLGAAVEWIEWKGNGKGKGQ